MFIYKSKSGKMSKLAVITGADGGMGKEITRAVAEAGYSGFISRYCISKYDSLFATFFSRPKKERV